METFGKLENFDSCSVLLMKKIREKIKPDFQADTKNILNEILSLNLKPKKKEKEYQQVPILNYIE